MRISLIGISVLICRHQFYPYNSKFHTAEENEKLQKETHRSWKPDEGSRNFQQGETARAAYAKTQVQMRQWNNELNRYAEYKKLCAEREEKPAYQTLGSFRRAYRSEEESLSYAKSHYARRDANEYNEFEKVIGKTNMPKTLADFQQMKYNENRRFDLFRQYKESVAKGKVNNIGFTEFERVLKKANQEIIGITTSTGVKVEGISYHLIERIIGNEKEKRLGVPIAKVVDTLKNGFCDGKIKINDKGQKSVGFILDDAYVSFNLDTKTVIQCRPASRKERR